MVPRWSSRKKEDAAWKTYALSLFDVGFKHITALDKLSDKLPRR